MIGSITGAEVAIVKGFVIGIARSEGTEAHRSEQLLPHYLEDRTPLLLVEDGIRQRDGEHLVGAERRIIASRFLVDYVVAIAQLG
jgi:hypothetical protein